MTLAFLPSPDQGVWYLGPFPVRGYALCIILGVIAAVWLGERRWVARGGQPGTVGDIAVWAVPFGLVGGRLYHVLTDPQLYFAEGKDPVAALYVWRGGLGIWGAVALGALGAYIGCRRRGVKFRAFADAVAPGIVLAQAIGRWGNWFNQELFGKPTTLPWGLEIDPAHRGDLQQYETFHPTFLYESLWDLGVAGLVIWADRRFRLGYGRAFAVYVMAYTAGRVWIEYLRVDPVNDIFGVRLNVWTSIIVFLAAAAYFVVTTRRHPGRETDVQPEPATDGPADAVPSDEHSEPADADASPDDADQAAPDGEALDAAAPHRSKPLRT
ncbi:MAG: prolipoprotein diacylglyceryl transferase [Propionibacteriales bacterium]|nr:prolipoprotein diacylglyceryl transferase [Propionibacteriales bacterium]